MVQELEKIKIILENIINEEEWDLSEEEKRKLNLYLKKLFEILNKYKNEFVIGSFKENDAYIKQLITNISKLKPKIEKIKRTTKEGITNEEYETLKNWDNCEKMLTLIQNKMANSNKEIDKAKEEGKPIISKYTNKELRKNIDWNTLKEKINYFPY